MATHGGNQGGEDLSRNEIKSKLRELEQGLDDLRRQYEQFFVGNRERPPTNERRQVSRLVRELQRANMTNTSQKFKFRGLMQRFNTYKSKWNRVERQIEEGTYEPHQKRAEDRIADHDTSPDENEPAADLAEDTEPDDTEPGDGAYELELDGDVDLDDMQRELEQMDREGEFEPYVETERVDVELKSDDRTRDEHSSRDSEAHARRAETEQPHTRSGDEGASRATSKDESFEEDRETKRKENLRKLQDELGLSKGGNGGSQDSEDRRDTLNKMRERLEQSRSNEEQRERSARDGGSSRSTREDDSSHDELELERADTDRVDSIDDRSSDASQTDRETTHRSSREDHDSTPARDTAPSRPPTRRDPSPEPPSNASGDTRTDDSRPQKAEHRSSSRRGSSDRGRSDSSESERSSSDDEEDGDTRRLYEQLVRAKEACSQATAHLTFEAIRNALQTERARLAHRRRIDREAVSFRVVLKDGNAYFQPTFDV